MSPFQTIGEVYQEASFLLGDAFEAELLLRKLLDIDRTTFYLSFQKPFPQSKQVQWKKWLEKRKRHFPIQYILGEQEFYGRLFEVNRSVLIPRPETEILVEKVLTHLATHRKHSSPHVVDLGTGSGAIAVTLAAENKNIRVSAVDCSSQALQVAMKNAKRHGVDDRIQFIQGDFLVPLMEESREVDVVVSNPPYIPSGDLAHLEKQVRDFEPTLALDGGSDGLKAYEKILDQLKKGELLSSKWLIAFEIGFSQKAEVSRLIRTFFPTAKVNVYQDLAGFDRVVIAQVV